MLRCWTAFLPCVLVVTGCAAGEETPSPEPAGEPDVFVCQTHELTCDAELTTSLSLTSGATQEDRIEAESDDGAVFSTTVDATAGGLVADPRQPFVYARFTADGLEQVDLADDEALASTAWDIAFHRYIIRTNGGSSGPSCVQAAAVDGAFDDVTAVPADGFGSDDQFDAECAFLADAEAEDPDNEKDYGLALRDYYNYVGCLQMTEQVFVLRLDDERVVKLQVMGFYEEQAQADCDELGSNIPIGSAHLRLRWAFL